MKRILITGFEPFNNEAINPSWEAVARLPEVINGFAISKLCLPVVFGEAASAALAVAEEIEPEFIVCIGQAGGRSAITPELVAINLRHGSISDNNGYMPIDEPIIAGGENAYFSTLPVRELTEAIKAKEINAAVSYSAGAYVCNDLLYTLLHRYKSTQTRVGFIHIPYCTEQNKEPSMDTDVIVRGLTAAIEALK
ncbi:MAG: pyroglutamyl-peptidase I [Clostridia bacterium]|nr:pyroglutamyl-peptidase I [Clostridia bacterium]